MFVHEGEALSTSCILIAIQRELGSPAHATKKSHEHKMPKPVCLRGSTAKQFEFFGLGASLCVYANVMGCWPGHVLPTDPDDRRVRIIVRDPGALPLSIAPSLYLSLHLASTVYLQLHLHACTVCVGMYIYTHMVYELLV